MAVGIRESDIEIFAKNGISEDNIRETISTYRNEGISDEEIQQKFQAKLQEFNTPKTTEKKEEVYKGPSWLQGSTRETISGFTLQAAPYIAGATNIGAKQISAISEANPEIPALAIATNPTLQVLGLARGVATGKIKASDLNPIKSFKEGKQEYQQEQEQFAEAYPKSASAANLVGSFGGMALGGAKLAGGALKVLANAPKAIKALGTSFAAMQPLAVEKGIEESLKEDATVGSIAKAIGIGELEAAAFATTLGALNPAEAKLVAKASRMTGDSSKFLKFTAPAIAKGAGMLTEGTAIGSIPALMEGRLPTKREVGTGIVATGVLRGAGAGLGYAGGKLRKATTEPSAVEQAEIKGKYEQIKQLDTEIANSENRIQEISQAEKPTPELKAEKKNLEYQKRWLLAEKENVLRENKFPKVVVKEASDLEVHNYLKDHPTTTPATAQKIISDAKTKASVLEKPKSDLGLGERFGRSVRAKVEGIRTTFDQLRPIKELESKIETATGKKLPEDLKPSNKLEDFATGGEVDVQLADYGDELKALFEKDKDLQRNIDVYTQAKKRIDFGKGSKLDEQIVAEATDDVKQGAELLYKINQSYLDMLNESGRLSKEFYQKLKQNKSYVPSQADNLEEKLSGEMSVGSIENTLKKFGGAEPFYKETTRASLEQGKRIHNFKLMQDAKKAYIDLAKSMGEARKVNVKPTNYNKDNQIVIWKNGEGQVYEVPEEIAKIFNPKPLEEEGLLKKGARTLQQSFKALTTGLPIGFAMRNIKRDPQAAKTSKYGKYITPGSMAEAADIMLSKDAMKRADVKEVQRAIGYRGTRAVSQIQDTNARDILDKVIGSNNSMSNAYPENSAGHKLMQNMSLALQENAKKASKVAPKVWQKFLEGASYLGERSEMITRYASWKAVLEGNAKNEAELAMWLNNPKTIPPAIRAEARKEAREATLNFTRKMHPTIEKINRYYVPYFKPGILGSARMFETLTNPEIAPQAWRFIANLGALEAQFKMGKMSEEEKDLYKQLDREQKTNYLEVVKDGKLYTIPLNQEHAQLVKLASIGVQRFLSDNEREELWKEAKEDLGQLGWNASMVGSAFASGNIAPQMFKPIAEVALNKNFFTKAEIETKAMRTRPKEERYTDTTPEIAKKLNKVLPFLSPRQIEHLIYGYGSSTAKEILIFEGLEEELKPLLKGEVSVNMRNLGASNPLVKDVMPNLDSPRNQLNTDANEIIERVKQSHYLLSKPTKEAKLTDKQRARYERDEDIYTDPDFKQATRDLTRIQKERNEIFSDAEEKQLELNNDVKSKNKTLKQAKLLARTWAIKYTKELRELNKEEKELWQEIINLEKNTPK